MDTFDKAIEIVLANEGDAFTDIPEDRGGATKYGISQRFNPDIDVRNLTREQAIEIYRARYWDGRKYDLLPEPIAIKVFDLAVNFGAGVAVMCLQRALRSCENIVTVDGKLGSETIFSAHKVSSVALLAAIRSEAAGEYRIRIAKRPDQVKFERGWLNRAYS